MYLLKLIIIILYGKLETYGRNTIRAGKFSESLEHDLRRLSFWLIQAIGMFWYLVIIKFKFKYYLGTQVWHKSDLFFSQESTSTYREKYFLYL